MDQLILIPDVSPFFISMNFLDKVFAKFGYLSKKGLSPYLGTAGGNGGLLSVLSGKDIDPKAAMEAYNGWVYACASVIGEELAKTQFRLFKVGKDESREEIFNHELLDQLNKPNKFQTGWEMKFLMGVHLVMVGKFYLYLEGVADENSKPKGLYPLLPQHIKPLMGTTIEDLIKGYEYNLGTSKATYSIHQVLCVRYPSPTKIFEGMGVVAGIPGWIDSDNYATEFNRKFFENFAMVGGYLESSDYTSPEMLDYMATKFQELHAGSKNAYKTVAMPQGTKFTPAQRTQQEMDFVSSSKDMRDKIMAGFRVPKSVLGLTEDVNRANAEATDYIFATRTIKPKLDLITEFFNAYLVPRYGENLVLGYVDPTPENKELEVQQDQAALAQQPYKSVNEVREEHGLPPIQNGDAVMTDFSKSPLGEAIKSTKKYKPQAKGIVVKKMPKQKNLIQDTAGELAKEAVKAIGSIPKITKELDREKMQVIWKGIVQRVSPYEKKVIGNMKKVNEQWFKEVNANISKFKNKSIDPEDLFDEEELITATIDLNKPTLTDLYKKEGLAAAKLINVNDFKFTPELEKALDKTISLLAESYTKTTLELLKTKLEEAISEGASIAERIKEIKEFSDEVRAASVAKTETFRIANTAAKESWKQNGIAKIIWFTAEDELVCPFCESMDGKTVGIEENFFDKGDSLTVGDQTLNFGYADIEAGSLHSNCRCITKPVVSASDL